MGIFLFGSKKKLVQFPIGELLKTDMHSHILPGVDDGSPDVATSLQLMRGLADMGYDTLIATPHIMADIHRNDKHTIQHAYEQLKQAAETDPTLPKVRFAAEFMMDEGFGHLVKQDALIPLAGDQYLLVETPYLHRPLNLESYIFNLRAIGYTPVLAHPERYHYLFDKPEEYERLKELGCLFQVNLLSLMGYYGKSEKYAAEWLLEEGLVDLLGTDLHHERHLKRLLNFTVDQKLVKVLENGSFLNRQLIATAAVNLFGT